MNDNGQQEKKAATRHCRTLYGTATLCLNGSACTVLLSVNDSITLFLCFGFDVGWTQLGKAQCA